MHLRYHKKFNKQFNNLQPAQKKRLGEALGLFINDPYHPKLYNHSLSGEWRDYRSISFGGDWRAHYKLIDEDTAIFVALGTHSQLYK